MTASTSESPHIRVLMSRLPPVIGELLTRRVEAAGMEVVEVIDSIDPILFESIKDRVDVLILGAKQAYPPQKVICELLRIAPKLRILVLQVKDDVMIEYWLGLCYERTRAFNSMDTVLRIQELHERDVMEWQDG